MKMGKYTLIVCALMVSSASFASYSPACQGWTTTPELTREGTVQIKVDHHSLGTGFFISETLIATSWQVVSDESAMWKPLDGLSVVCPDGQVISAECIVIPTSVQPEPYNYDFTVLELAEQPTETHTIFSISTGSDLPRIGSIAYFSGFPFGSPLMLTNRGMISGNDTTTFDQTFVQAEIKKGYYGGALIINDKVVGILSGYAGSSIDRENDQSAEEVVAQDGYRIAGTGFAISTKYLYEYLIANSILSL